MSNQNIVESHSFDYIPENERHGNVRSQAQLWFMVNATLITLYTGAVGPSSGLGITWSIVAIVLGSICGTLFQAFHGAQGPRMGLPQMIQSRVQFGSRGAILPLAAAMITQFGFAIFFIQTGAQSLVDVSGIEKYNIFQILVGLVAILAAIVGYRFVLKFEKIASYAALINFGLLTVAAFMYLPSLKTSGGGFVFLPFLSQLGASAIYQLAIAPIVSDYTRYLPKRTNGAAVSAAVFCGTMLSAVWLESLGAALTLAYPNNDVIASVHDLGNNFGFGLGTITMLVAAATCLITTAITFYSGTVAVLSAAEAFRTIKSTVVLRSGTIIVTGIGVIIACLYLPSDFLAAFAVFLSFVGYFLVPWTAVNLVDYYFVRKGKFSITDIMQPHGGIYGQWNTAGLVSYLVGFLCMIPFFSTSVYTGVFAQALGGADVSFAVGLIVSLVCYLVMTRSHDLASEFDYVRKAAENTLN